MIVAEITLHLLAAPADVRAPEWEEGAADPRKDLTGEKLGLYQLARSTQNHRHSQRASGQRGQRPTSPEPKSPAPIAPRYFEIAAPYPAPQPGFSDATRCARCLMVSSSCCVRTALAGRSFCLSLASFPGNRRRLSASCGAGQKGSRMFLIRPEINARLNIAGAGADRMRGR